MLRKLFDRPEPAHSIWTDEETARPRAEVLLDATAQHSAHVMLRKRPHEVRLKVVPGSEATVRFQTHSSPDQHGNKSGIIWVKFLDSLGREVPSRGRISKGRQGHYVYIVPDATGWAESTLYIPHDSTEVVLGLALWKGYPGSLSLGNTLSVSHNVLPPFASSSNGNGDPSGLRHHRCVLSAGHVPTEELDLTKQAYWLSLSTLDARHFSVRTHVRGQKPVGPRDTVVLFKFMDQHGDEVGSLTDVPRGPIGEYTYMVPDSSGDYSFEVHAPEDCVRVSIGFASWHAAPGSVKIANTLHITELSPESANELRPGFGPPQNEPGAYRFDRLTELGADIPITPRTRWARIPITHIKTPRLEVQFSVTPLVGGLSKKSALALIEFAEKGGGSIAPSDLSMSKEHGAYRYIDGRSPNLVSLSLEIPADATEIRVGTMLWEATKNQVQVGNRIQIEAVKTPQPIPTSPETTQSHARGRLTNATETPDRPRRAKNLKVALIADEFTYNCFKYEFTPVIVEPQDWRERFEADRPDLFICESAWSGIDSERRPWKGQVYSSSNFANENRRELLQILEWCKRENVPTVFWNKEDPTHFDDKVHNFIDTAVRFDHVFTTDAACVPRYQEEYGHPSVHCLPFATQPRLFNPVETSPRAEGVSFAGSWYANHLERSKEMQIIFDQIIEADMDLRIYDRFWGSDDELHHFPEKYRHLTEAAIPHSRIAEAYKSTTFGLNINTVTSSPTMFARRIFELMSCNTLVVSNYSPGVEKFFEGRILFAGEDHFDILEVDERTAGELRHAALHDVLAHHTYQRRFEQILDAIGFDYAKPSGLVTLVCPVENEAELNEAIARQAEFVDIAERLVIVLGRAFPKRDAAYLQAKYGRFGVVIVSWAWANDAVLDPASYVKGDLFALIAPASEITSSEIYEASLHSSYVDGPIVMGSPERYRFATEHTVEDLVAGPQFFQKAIKNYGLTVSDNFYLV